MVKKKTRKVTLREYLLSKGITNLSHAKMTRIGHIVANSYKLDRKGKLPDSKVTKYKNANGKNSVSTVYCYAQEDHYLIDKALTLLGLTK